MEISLVILTKARQDCDITGSQVMYSDETEILAIILYFFSRNVGLSALTPLSGPEAVYSHRLLPLK